ncbi:MAG: menaquinone biosynthesis protein, partial [Firmicutes bacterium]|nr:menaquinone biosynthesis protein [Bacillota bacterium]
PERIQTLALDASSRTSVVLGQILLRERYGARPVTVDAPPDPQAMLEAHDAALVIGDPAMRARKEGLHVLDLAEEWHAWTGLPFVFALWMVRGQAPSIATPDGVASFFHRSLDMGQSHLQAIIDEAWPSIGWTKLELREYLTENISYHLGEAERQSLELFFQKAVEHGFAPQNKALAFL